jgi:hypothetical protein
MVSKGSLFIVGAVLADALVTDFEKIRLEDDFDVPAR